MLRHPVWRRSSVLGLVALALWAYTGNAQAAPPPTPTQIAPASGSNVPGTAVYFEWNVSFGASDYFLEVNDGQQAVFAEWVGNTTNIILSPFPDCGQVYYWRVAAWNADGAGFFSGYWWFRNGPSALPATPSPVSPANGANVAGTSITFTWTQAARACNYYFQLATDPAFTEVVFGQWLGNYIGITFDGFPDDGQVYYWRVAAGNAVGGSSPFSAARSVTNGPSAPPATPAQVSPANGANVPGTSITFEWSQAARANDYFFQLAADAGFTEVLYGQWIGNFIGITFSDLPDDGQIYFWRVAARNARGSSPFSGAWSVTNGPSAPPATPAQVSPANEATVAGTSISFTWTQAARANDYLIEVAIDSGFTELVFGQWVGNALGATVSGFPDNGGVYFWRVAARNALGSTPFSSTRVFTNGVTRCGDERDVMIQEYIDYGVNLRPICSDFAGSGGTANFSWSELNGGFREGNPHIPWGIIRSGLTTGLEATRTNYGNNPIPLSSGYRCPHGNRQVGGVAQSLHMHGRAADVCRVGQPNCGWTEDEFNRLKAAADATSPSPIESFFWSTYADHHYHVGW
jgi:hypothetical protein